MTQQQPDPRLEAKRVKALIANPKWEGLSFERKMRVLSEVAQREGVESEEEQTKWAQEVYGLLYPAAEPSGKKKANPLHKVLQKISSLLSRKSTLAA